MVHLVTTSGPVIVNDDAIARIISRTLDFPYTHVWGPAGSAPLEVVEDAQALVARLRLNTPLAKLTAPAGAPIWIKGAAVTLLRSATPFEHGTQPPFINSIVIVSGRTQSMHEDLQTARAVLVNAGARLPNSPLNIATLQGSAEGFSLTSDTFQQTFQLW